MPRCSIWAPKALTTTKERNKQKISNVAIYMDIYIKNYTYRNVYIYVYSIALDSVRLGLVCFYLCTEGGIAAFLSTMELFGGDTAKNPEMLHSCYKGVTQNNNRSQPGIRDTIASPDSSGSDIRGGIRGQRVIYIQHMIKPCHNHSASGHKEVASQGHKSDDL